MNYRRRHDNVPLELPFGLQFVPAVISTLTGMATSFWTITAIVTLFAPAAAVLGFRRADLPSPEVATIFALLIGLLLAGLCYIILADFLSNKVSQAK